MSAGRPVRIRTRSEEVVAGNGTDPLCPDSGPLVDAFGRIHRDLRISVTDRCNLRCTYCMPEEGMVFLPREQLLTFEEIAKVAGVARRLGVESVRISGGEPLVRRDLEVLVSLLAGTGFSDLAMTTNAMMLTRRAPALAAAGLKRLNVSCDSLDAGRFSAIRRGGDLPTVLKAMDAAEASGLGPVKVNVVVMRGVNDVEIEDFARFGRDTGRTVRFIEFMPLDAEGSWSRDSVVPSEEVLDRIGRLWSLEVADSDPVAPASLYRYRDGGGEVGVIASVTQPFCGSCDRLRLTAEGNLRNCLFAHEEVPLRPLLRGERIGEPEELVERALRLSVWRKKSGHGIGDPDFTRPKRTMSMIGG